MKNTGLTELVPSEFYLSQNYPDPFSEKTTMKFCVAYRTRVRLEVFDSEGKVVEALMDEEKEAGTYEVEFSASVGHSGERRNPPDGIFVCQLQAGGLLLTKKMRLLRQT